RQWTPKPDAGIEPADCEPRGSALDRFPGDGPHAFSTPQTYLRQLAMRGRIPHPHHPVSAARSDHSPRPIPRDRRRRAVVCPNAELGNKATGLPDGDLTVAAGRDKTRPVSGDGERVNAIF